MITYYKIYNIEDPKIFYIGSTLNFSRRKSHHKKNTKNKVGKLYWTLLYKTIREKGGWEKFVMVKIWETEEHELRALEEQAIIRIYNPPLNKNKATIKEIEEDLLNKIKNLNL
jgi:predicted GIY-YIG superfamily endonuclease